MDTRHESFKEAFLNHVINTINSYVNNNIDDLIENTIIQDEIYAICKQVYYYLGINVDVKGILSKHNLLSIDVVLFPSVCDTEANRVLNDQAFEKLIKEIKLIVSHQANLPANNEFNNVLRKNIINLFDEYRI